MVGFPPNVTRVARIPSLILPPSPASAMSAAPIVSGVVPYSFESTMRTRLPPMLRRAVWRMVCFHKFAGMPSGTGKSGPHAGWGLDVHEPIQLPASAALEAGENPTTPASARAKHAVRQLTFAMADARRETTRSFISSSPISLND